MSCFHQDFEFKELNEFVKYQPHCYHGVDKEGRPVFIARPKKDYRNEPFITTTRDRCLKYLIQEREKLFAIKFPACTIASKRLIDSTIQIIDVQDIVCCHYIFLSALSVNFYNMKKIFMLFVILGPLLLCKG
jgi:hypothetical protein